MATSPRTDSLANLIADLRARHARLLVVVGEHHDSLQTRKRFTELAKMSDFAMFEAPNQDGSPSGQVVYPKESLELLKELSRKGKSSPQLLELGRAYNSAPYAVRVDVDAPDKAKQLLTTIAAANRLEKDNVPPDDRVHRAVNTILTARLEDRIRASNPVMGRTVAHHITEHVQPKAPFFGVLLVGGGHIMDPEHMNALGTELDLAHTIGQAGCKVVTLQFNPRHQRSPTDRPGTYTIRTDNTQRSVDYFVDITDPNTRVASLQC